MTNITIILAAGKNVRLRDICFDAPKGMLSINGQGIVERLCLQFHPFSKNIIVVAGSNISSYQYLESKISNIIVVGEMNKQHVSNSESLLEGLNHIREKTDTITIVEGDVVLSNLSIKLYFSFLEKNRFIITNALLNNSDDKTIFDKNKHCYYIDKDSSLHARDDSYQTIGKYLGVTTFSSNIIGSLKTSLKINIKLSYTKTIQNYLDDSFRTIFIDKEQGFEIDTSSDYFQALTNYNISRVIDNTSDNLYFSNKTLLYTGIYDVFGGLIAQRLGFDGLWLGSYQISLSNGVKDDETFNPLISLELAKKLKKNLVKLPIIIDLGSGFQSENDVEVFAKESKHTNIVAVCIDDNKGTRTNSMFERSERQILKDKDFLNRINNLRKKLPSNIKIIARTEALTIYKYEIDIVKLSERIRLLQDNCVDAILPHYVGKDFSFIKDIINKIESKKPFILIPTGLINVSKKDFCELGINLIIYANIDIRARFKSIKDIYLLLSTTGRLDDSYLGLLASPLEISKCLGTND